MGEKGYLSAILIKLRDPGEKQAVIDGLQRLLPADVTVQSPARRTQQVDIMLAAFRLNLTALSLVSLMVGMFFVGNSAAASVVRRRVSLGILRALGTGRPMILAMVLVEAAISGLIGSVLGVLISPLIASILAAPVAQTVTALYLPVDAHGGWPTPLEALAGMVAGVLASLVAAWIPARQAAAVDPTKVLHPGTAPEIFPIPALPSAFCGVVSGPARGTIDFLHGKVAQKTRALERGEGIALSESLGRRLKLGPGDTLVLYGPKGPLVLPVIDLYRDYTSRPRHCDDRGGLFCQGVGGPRGALSGDRACTRNARHD